MAVATASVPPPQLDDTEQHEQQQPFTVKFDLPLMSRKQQHRNVTVRDAEDGADMLPAAITVKTAAAANHYYRQMMEELDAFNDDDDDDDDDAVVLPKTSPQRPAAPQQMPPKPKKNVRFNENLNQFHIPTPAFDDDEDTETEDHDDERTEHDHDDSEDDSEDDSDTDDEQHQQPSTRGKTSGGVVLKPGGSIEEIKEQLAARGEKFNSLAATRLWLQINGLADGDGDDDDELDDEDDDELIGPPVTSPTDVRSLYLSPVVQHNSASSSGSSASPGFDNRPQKQLDTSEPPPIITDSTDELSHVFGQNHIHRKDSFTLYQHKLQERRHNHYDPPLNSPAISPSSSGSNGGGGGSATLHRNGASIGGYDEDDDEEEEEDGYGRDQEDNDDDDDDDDLDDEAFLMKATGIVDVHNVRGSSPTSKSPARSPIRSPVRSPRSSFYAPNTSIRTRVMALVPRLPILSDLVHFALTAAYELSMAVAVGVGIVVVVLFSLAYDRRG